MEQPFWSLERNLLEARKQLENACDRAETLKEALDTGANSIRLLDSEGEEKYIGYLSENGEYELNDEDIDLNTPVVFYSLDRDEDGLTIALFHKKEG